jgi:hypothetical protein
MDERANVTYLLPTDTTWLIQTPLPLAKNLGGISVTLKIEQDPGRLFKTSKMLTESQLTWLAAVRGINRKYIYPHLLQVRGLWNKVPETSGVTVCSGEVTSADALTLIDNTATFLTDGVLAGDVVTVTGKGATAVSIVNSETELTVTAGLAGGFEIGDDYTITSTETKYQPYLGAGRVWREFSEPTPRATVYGAIQMNYRLATDWARGQHTAAEGDGSYITKNDLWYATRAFRPSVEIYHDEQLVDSCVPRTEPCIVRHGGELHPPGWADIPDPLMKAIYGYTTECYPDQRPSELLHAAGDEVHAFPDLPEYHYAQQAWKDTRDGVEYNTTIDGYGRMTVNLTADGLTKPLYFRCNVAQDKVLCPADIGMINVTADFYDYFPTAGKTFDKALSTIDRIGTVKNNGVRAYYNFASPQNLAPIQRSGPAYNAWFGPATAYRNSDVRYMAEPLCPLSRKALREAERVWPGVSDWFYELYVGIPSTFTDKTLVQMLGFGEWYHRFEDFNNWHFDQWNYYGLLRSLALFGLDKSISIGGEDPQYYNPLACDLSIVDIVTVDPGAVDPPPAPVKPDNFDNLLAAIDLRQYFEIQDRQVPRVKVSISATWNDQDGNPVTVNKFYYSPIPFSWYKQAKAYVLTDWLTNTPAWQDVWTETNGDEWTVLARATRDAFSYGEIGAGDLDFEILINDGGIGLRHVGGSLGPLIEGPDSYSWCWADFNARGSWVAFDDVDTKSWTTSASKVWYRYFVDHHEHYGIPIEPNGF